MEFINIETTNTKNNLNNQLKDSLKELNLLVSEFIPIDNLYYKYIDEVEYKEKFKEINTKREHLLNKIRLTHMKIDELEKYLEFNM